jgi:hypothetical protein
MHTYRIVIDIEASTDNASGVNEAVKNKVLQVLGEVEGRIHIPQKLLSITTTKTSKDEQRLVENSSPQHGS